MEDQPGQTTEQGNVEFSVFEILPKNKRTEEKLAEREAKKAKEKERREEVSSLTPAQEETTKGPQQQEKDGASRPENERNARH